MNYSISNTAEYGDLTRGPRVVTSTTKAEMKKILSEIQSGQFVKEFMADMKSGDKFAALRKKGETHPIEATGEKLRAMMPWIGKNKLVNKSAN